MERIWGPVNGFYLAAYAAPATDGEHFASYAKVCWRRPESYWDADCAFKLFGGEHHCSPEAALAAVAADAANETSYLPSHARSMAQQRQRQRQHAALSALFASASARHRLA